LRTRVLGSKAKVAPRRASAVDRSYDHRKLISGYGTEHDCTAAEELSVELGDEVVVKPPPSGTDTEDLTYKPWSRKVRRTGSP
jgi:hypothetical protein